MCDSHGDEKITEMFKKDLDDIEQDENEHWLKEKNGAFAYILCCDWFSRCIYKNQDKAYSFDSRALRAARLLIDNNRFNDYKNYEKLFINMVLMHQEQSKYTQESIDNLNNII